MIVTIVNTRSVLPCLDASSAMHRAQRASRTLENLCLKSMSSFNCIEFISKTKSTKGTWLNAAATALLTLSGSERTGIILTALEVADAWSSIVKAPERIVSIRGATLNGGFSTFIMLQKSLKAFC